MQKPDHWSGFFLLQTFTGRYFTMQLRDVINMPLPLAW